MTIARFYVMHAADDKHAILEAALSTLADAVKALPGSEGVDLLHDSEDIGRFIFIEKWASKEAHKAAGKRLSKEVMAPLMGALKGAPEGSYLDYLKTL